MDFYRIAFVTVLFAVLFFVPPYFEAGKRRRALVERKKRQRKHV